MGCQGAILLALLNHQTSNIKQKDFMMKKMLAVFFVALLTTASFSALACPKGEHPHGGTGSHHKGGYCSY